ncbi:cytochrome aa3 quinol oxidase subunit III [Cohnella sp. CIP 111063]|uniref:cytochrome aa3 quinol oxidase subunit III n=1 Tax=unclassified Cohnella TaxID=2636738 RepID=UPI000B8BEB8C|nr:MULTISPECIES: cytochrome aa3 quinol oxidase subunit III [unclassified Cohnella]OXS54903.1 cytochrome aa3 quinol oxidase subunit III [Cohnella sp. CIP 111063]PRX65053.1 cytochrome aa3 quinol oxidase subunit 3 [Cohnella sp. SGD-V74]
MAQINTTNNPDTPLEYQSETGRLNIFGFWIFLGAEVALFATLFAAYFALKDGTAGGPLPIDVFDLNNTIIMTLILLISSFTSGLAIHEMRRNNVKSMIVWLVITLIFGLAFLYMEIEEFIHLVNEGANLGTNAYWSSFYLLTGTHGLHVTFGICWIVLIITQVLRRGLTPETAKKVFVSSLYWHFLDFVWIFVFTGVYLLGMVG